MAGSAQFQQGKASLPDQSKIAFLKGMFGDRLKDLADGTYASRKNNNRIGYDPGENQARRGEIAMHITRGEFAYAQISFVLLILLVSMFICDSCVWICGDTHLSPKQLLDENDYVLLGEPVSVDTLIDLGPLEYLGHKEVAYMVEYTYKPREIFKGDKSVKYIYLWWCVTIILKDGYNNSPKTDSLELIYGNVLGSWDSVIYIYTPKVAWIGAIPVLRDWVNGNSPEDGWASDVGDSTVMARIMASTQLASILANRNHTGRVIYGTEDGYFTHNSFHYNEMLYCDCIWGPAHFLVNRSDFVESLRSLSR